MTLFVGLVSLLVMACMMAVATMVHHDGLGARSSSGLARDYVPPTLPDHPYRDGPLDH